MPIEWLPVHCEWMTMPIERLAVPTDWTSGCVQVFERMAMKAVESLVLYCTLFESLPMTTDWVFGKWLLIRLNIVWMDSYAKWLGVWLYYWIGWQCQLSSSLHAHIVWVFGNANRVRRWMRILSEGLAVPIQWLAGCARSLNRWLPTIERLGVHIAWIDGYYS